MGGNQIHNVKAGTKDTDAVKRISIETINW